MPQSFCVATGMNAARRVGMQTITRDELKKKIERNDPFCLVEVLGPEAYEEYHLPTAINVPFGEQFAASVQRAAPDKRRTIVVYCKDEDCNTSSKAAERLDAIGYKDVRDFSGGKVDWKDAGLHVETSRRVSPGTIAAIAVVNVA